MPRHASRESAPFYLASPDKTSLALYPFFLSPCIPFLFPCSVPLSVPLVLFPLFTIYSVSCHILPNCLGLSP